MLILLYQKEHKISLTIHTSTWTYSKGSVNLLRINCVLQTSLHTQRFGLTVSSRRCPSSFYESYRMGGTSHSTSLMPQFLQAVIRPQHDAFVELKRFGEPFEDYLHFTNKLTHSAVRYYRIVSS